VTLLYTKCKWCRNVQDTSALGRSVSDFYRGAEVSIGHFGRTMYVIMPWWYNVCHGFLFTSKARCSLIVMKAPLTKINHSIVLLAKISLSITNPV